ncbi:transposase [Xenorhabdus bovienii]|uniref:Transposase n=1 Tax=Xenorhabdus bovienii TaxID=40576 RepID=A0AAJ1J7E2_XENBV|nr:transposase [Xenorhabdus bovienii]MDE1487679.1 transposase [Xenorhabdus bovienii]MDE1493098.1 transposase [Xenorhabdus bovienii]MDE1496616.1 transposase [Xenorhabdus bovienii]MDE9475226.1 transposase [Xenorhabdus bovienii]
MPGADKTPEQWPAEARLAVIIETATLSSTEVAEYCRKKGLYPKQIQQWKQAFLQGFCRINGELIRDPASGYFLYCQSIKLFRRR